MDAFDRLVQAEGLDNARRTTLRLFDPAATVRGTPWLVDPSEMATRAYRAASAIHHATLRSNEVLIAARLAKPESVAVGHLLQFWSSNENHHQRPGELAYINWSAATQSFETWRLRPERVIAVGDANEIVNLTPHPVRLFNTKGVAILELEPGGQAARVADRLHPGPRISFRGSELPVLRIKAGPVTDLPPPVNGRLYVTSRVTAARCSDRSDVVFPHDEIREAGTIIGCRTFATFAGSRDRSGWP